MRSTLMLMLAAALCVPSVGQADDRGVRAGLGLGASNIDFERGFSASDTAWSGFAAYEFNRYFAVEAMYVDGGSPADGGTTVDVRHAAIMASGSLPIGRLWSIGARAGVIGWSWESVGVKRDGTDLGYGFSTALDLERIQLKLIADTADIDDARIVHIGLLTAWKF